MKKNAEKILLLISTGALFIISGINRVCAFSVKVTNPISTSDFNKLVGNTLQWVLSVAGVLALVMLIVGGIMYITAGGVEEKITQAKKIITWTILGLALVLVSYAIISVLNDILTK